MNETITLPRLSELVASILGCQYGDSEKFIKTFFAHLADALAVSEEVSISGLGSFRRSGDLTNPLEFKADNSIAEALNLPFEMFEPVAIGNAELIDIPEISKIDVPCEGLNPTSIPDVEQIEANSIISEPLPPTITPEPTEAPIAVSPITDDPTPINEPNEISTLSECERPRPIFWFILIFILGLLIGGAMSYFGHDKIHALFGTTTLLPDKGGTTIEADGNKSDKSIYLDIEDTGQKHLDILTDTIIPATVEDTERVEIYDTVTPERFLTTMARQYYGQMEYWVFIYEANSDALGNPNRIKPGTRVIIPAKSEFTIDESPEQTLARAKQKGREIYQRFE